MKTKPGVRGLSQLSMAVTAALVLSACGESSSGTQGSQFGNNTGNTNTDFNQQQLVTSVVNNAILPSYNDFKSKAQQQVTDVKAWCDAQVLNTGDISGLKQTAQTSWRSAMDAWQVAEVMQIGPLLANDNSLRNKIYSWPNISRCAVDQDVVRAEDDGYNIADRTNTRRGLDAMEYLLFSPNLEHSCTIPGTEPVGWNERTELSRNIARCQFANLVANDLVTNVDDVIQQWQGDTGYAQRLINAGQAGAAIDDIHKAVNEISDALFYIDSSTKDAKLATPLGLFANDCGAQPCAQNVESPLSQHSLNNIINNLKGLDLLFRGGTGDSAVGFDDYLVDVGDSATALKMQQDISTAIQTASAINVSLAQALEQNPDSVTAVHTDVKDVTDSLKADFINSLALQLPATSAGDND